MRRGLLTFLKLVPKNALSRIVGGFLRGPWPRSVHRAIVRWFVRRYGVAVEESEHPPEHYETFNAFFTRRLRPGARPVAGGEVLVSPCDGRLGQSGRIEDGRALQAKGRPYSVAQLLGDDGLAQTFAGGSYLTLYLAPSDYHRVHAPVDGRIREARHIPGTLWPVNPPAVESIEDLFAVNERVVTVIDSAYGQVAVVMVGATCVGRIRMRYDEIVSNAGTKHGHRIYDPPIPIERGQELGVFEMGSTVVLLLEAGVFEATALETGRTVRMGEALGPLRPPLHRGDGVGRAVGVR